MENYKKIYDLIDYQSRILVGVLLKRLEVLDKEKAFSINLYKALIKEQIYENFRNLKQIIELQLEIGKVEFKSRDK